MCCPAGRNSFRQFLRTEFSEENMLFWLACDEFRSEANKSAIEEKARAIYEDYISILSPKEVWPPLNRRHSKWASLDGGAFSDFATPFPPGEPWFPGAWDHQQEHAGAHPAHLRWRPAADLHTNAKRLIPSLHELPGLQKPVQHSVGAVPWIVGWW